MTGRAFGHWLQIAAGALAVFVLLASLTATFYLHNARVDLSPGSRFTLSDHALAVLRDLQAPVRITAFIRTEDARNPVLKDLLWQVANESPHVTYSVVDVNRNPALATQYGVDTYGATVVESGGKRTDFTLPVESQLIAAILHVTRPPKKIYVLDGHGECSLDSTDRFSGCSGLRDALDSELYDVATMSLLAGNDVPTDADVVLIPGPRADFLPGELDVLARYLRRGGKLVVLLDPFASPKLAAFLVPYGIEAGANVVLDPENRLGGGEEFSAAAPNVNHRHLITSGLNAPPLFSSVRAIAGHDDDASGRRYDWLVKSGDRSWASHDRAVLDGANPVFVAGRDINGPLTLGAEVWMPVREGEGAPKGTVTRIIVYGDSDFVTNRFLDYLGNRDLILNTVNWLAREERLLAPRPRRMEPGKRIFFVSEADLARLFVASVVLLPGIFFVIGVAVFVRRRMSA
jgi:gliding motility-associatede transport system auxiliary component